MFIKIFFLYNLYSIYLTGTQLSAFSQDFLQNKIKEAKYSAPLLSIFFKNQLYESMIFFKNSTYSSRTFWGSTI